jgi:hypothetical protein
VQAIILAVWLAAVIAIIVWDHRDRDILVDDEGYRYAVAAAWWTPLSWNLSAVRLEASVGSIPSLVRPVCCAWISHAMFL